MNESCRICCGDVFIFSQLTGSFHIWISRLQESWTSCYFMFGRLELLQEKKGGTHMDVTQEDNQRQVKRIRTITREGN